MHPRISIYESERFLTSDHFRLDLQNIYRYTLWSLEFNNNQNWVQKFNTFMYALNHPFYSYSHFMVYTFETVCFDTVGGIFWGLPLIELEFLDASLWAALSLRPSVRWSVGRKPLFLEKWIWLEKAWQSSMIRPYSLLSSSSSSSSSFIQDASLFVPNLFYT